MIHMIGLFAVAPPLIITTILTAVSIPVLLIIVLLFYTSPRWNFRKTVAENPLFHTKNFSFHPSAKFDKGMTYRRLQREIMDAGYSYDSQQDIFYSTMNPWQREFGYCRLYDEAQTICGMIVDSEPIHFDYAGKKWMIEFWKGQYGMTTGGEVGIYTREEPDESPQSHFDIPLYQSAGDGDLLPMSFILLKKGTPLFTRSHRHWWLSGFKLGEFSEPSDLTMMIEIRLKDQAMLKAFMSGLKETGYTDEELKIDNKKNGIRILFTKPHSTQPIGRIPAVEWIEQRRNQAFCALFTELTGSYDNLPEKIRAVRRHSPQLFGEILRMGKVADTYRSHDTIMKLRKK